MILHEEIDERGSSRTLQLSDANWSANEHFWKIVSAIFGTHAEAATPTAAPEGGSGATSSSDAAAAGSVIDVAAILDKAVARKKEKLTWRTSIVYLMKALDIDSSQSARKELAKELKY